MLLLVEDRWMSVVGDEGVTALVDVKSAPPVRDLTEASGVRFRAWRIVRKGLGHEYDTICRYIVKAQSKAGFTWG